MRSRAWRIVLPLSLVLLLGILEKFTWLGTADVHLVLSIPQDGKYLRYAMLSITYATQAYVVFPVYLLLNAVDRGRRGLLKPLILLATEAGVLAMKFAFAIPRPIGDPWGYPSGHSARTFYLALVSEKRRWRWALTAVAVLVCLSRVLLAAHTITDLAGGALLAVASSEAVKWLESSRSS